jgi:hypothetical protein
MSTQKRLKTSDFWPMIGQLTENLVGEGGQMWLDSLKRFLRKENPWPVTTTATETAIWKTITLGLHKTPKAYRKVLENAGFKIGDWAKDILKEISIAQEPREIRLVIRSVADLGFTEATWYDVICARATELGLDLCPAEVGPALRLAYADQPYREWIVVAMEALTSRDRNLSVFSLEHDEGGRLLSAYYGTPGSCWTPGNRFVFVSREP